MPSAQRRNIDRVKTAHELTIKEVIKSLKDAGASKRVVKQYLTSIVDQEIGPTILSDRTTMTVEEYATLTTSNRDVLIDMFSRIKPSGTPQPMGCIISAAISSKTRPKVCCTRENRTVCEFLPSNMCQACVVLLYHGHIPQGQTWEVSHRCHNRLCIRVDHLVYEDPGEHGARKKCASLGRCQCQNTLVCIFEDE
jgi:hypothetical protein